MATVVLVARRRFTVMAALLGAVALMLGLSGASAATTVRRHHAAEPVFVHTTCHSEPASALHGPECICALNLHLVR